LTVGVGFLVFGCSSSSENVGDTSDTSEDLGVSTYDPSVAVAYATQHWDDGQGLCSEFTSRSLRAGNLGIQILPWVPNLEKALASVPYEEHRKGASSVSATAGDVIIYSNATGSSFCDDHSSDEHNCGHTCLITVGGNSEDSILADCHNNAHHHIAIGDELSDGYTTYRIYHLSGGHAAAPKGTEACSTDADCNGGKSGTETVCSRTEFYCIHGCHTDGDCPGSTTCTPTHPHYTCQ
jgi:hypothetical protein